MTFILCFSNILDINRLRVLNLLLLRGPQNPLKRFIRVLYFILGSYVPLALGGFMDPLLRTYLIYEKILSQKCLCFLLGSDVRHASRESSYALCRNRIRWIKRCTNQSTFLMITISKASHFYQ